MHVSLPQGHRVAFGERIPRLGAMQMHPCGAAGCRGAHCFGRAGRRCDEKRPPRLNGGRRRKGRGLTV
ncbi:hypothetical protein RGUI_0505 [Rhodovulum sp. P5]|nr:hypothetical protein RGUI_0505 [Rhodovulum sp. P5]